MSDFDNNPYAASNFDDNSGPQTPVHIPDYLVASILVTLFCCLPLGIPAIIFAAKTRSLKTAGHYQAALEQSGKAKLFVFLSLGFGLLVIIAQIAIQIAAINAGP